MSNTSVLIIGAGPTGMTAAIELKRAGFNVRIVDKSDHMAQFSQALVLQARTLEQLQRYGVSGKAVERGRKLRGAHFYSEGKQIFSFNFNRIASRYPYLLFLPQSETETLLNEHMEQLGVRAERQVELQSLAQADGSVHAILRHSDGSTEELNPRWVLGCDGAHSAVRQMTGTPFEGAGVGLSFFLGDLEIDGPDAPGEDLVIHVHRGDVVFMGRLSDKLVRLIVALHDTQDTDIHRELTLDDFQRAVDHGGVRIKVRSAEWMTPFRVNDRQAKHYRVGNAFLAGDASHIHSPVGGQGMNTGIQDVANLVWKLAAVTRGADDRLLDSYHEERGEVGRRLLRFTERGLKMATLANPLLEALRDAVVPLLAGSESMQTAITAFISETAIEYRSSSIVADHGGDGTLRAGDRLPDLAINNSAAPATLLQNWTSGKHLALVLNAPVDELNRLRAGLRHAELVPLHTVELGDEGLRLLGAERKVLIVRPDGYVGYRGPLDRTAEWRAYALQDALA